jgi:hypothetical protein
MLNIPKDWVISENSSLKVRIVLKDKGTTLMYYTLKANFLPLDISLKDASAMNDSTLIISNGIIRNAMDKQLTSTTSIVSIEPMDVLVKYDKLASKVVPVIPNIKILTKQGFQISDSIKVESPTVKLFASKKILDKIDVIRTKLVTLDNVSKTKQVEAGLDIPDDVKADNESVTLTIPVDEFTEKSFQLPVFCADIREGNMLRIFPSTVNVICNIPISHFKELVEDALEIHIPFQEFQDNQSSGKLPVRLTKKPDWLMNFNVEPATVEFIIEKTSVEQ